ncbi:hypothetical protein ACQKMI_16400 [Lysinibacillus sp. NPDC097214]
MTIKDITKPIVFTTVYTGNSVNTWAQSEWIPDEGTVYNTLLETGGVLS